MTTKFDLCLDYLSKEAVSHQWLRNAVRKAKVPDDVGEAQTRMLKAYQTYAKPLIAQSKDVITGSKSNMKRLSAAKTMEKRLIKSTDEHGWLGKYGEGSAAPPKKKSPTVEALKVIGSGVAGLGAGHMAGYGVGKAIEHISGKKGGNAAGIARKIAPAVGGAAGIIYPIWQNQQQKAVRDAVESAHNQSDRRVPGK